MWLSAWLLLCVPCLLSSPYYEREDHMLSLDDFDSLYADSVRLAQDTKEADEPAEKEPVEDAEGEEEGAEGDEEPAEGDEEPAEGDEENQRVTKQQKARIPPPRRKPPPRR